MASGVILSSVGRAVRKGGQSQSSLIDAPCAPAVLRWRSLLDSLLAALHTTRSAEASEARRICTQSRASLRQCAPCSSAHSACRARCAAVLRCRCLHSLRCAAARRSSCAPSTASTSMRTALSATRQAARCPLAFMSATPPLPQVRSVRALTCSHALQPCTLHCCRMGPPRCLCSCTPRSPSYASHALALLCLSSAVLSALSALCLSALVALQQPSSPPRRRRVCAHSMQLLSTPHDAVAPHPRYCRGCRAGC